MTVTIRDLEWSPHVGGERATHEFANGYTASVLRGGPFYTAGGTFEIAVMHNDKITYDTPITNDVLGYLSEQEANAALADISALPPRKEA